MHNLKPSFAKLAFLALLLAASVNIVPAQARSSIGIFENHSDIGVVQPPGTALYDPASASYTLAASGENIWAGSDNFQFAWKKLSGDFALSADISFVGAGKNPHRKAVLMFRQDLDPDSVYADVALHGTGLTALQYRDVKGAGTQEIQSNISAPKKLRIVKRGDYVYMSLAQNSEGPQFSGGWMKIPLRGDFYVGIGLCSHDNNVVEKAIFSDLTIETLVPATTEPKLYSTLETIAVSSTDRQVVYIAPDRFEAPNWTRDGESFIFNRNGRLEQLSITGGEPREIDTGFAIRCNNDHGISPDSKWIAISDQSAEDHRSLIYIVPFTGGAPRRITRKSPSYWHGWSPDGLTLAFVGQRNDDFDIYAIPVAGGEETRLTTAKGLDDGPEYSPDGKYIYFNSERTGHMQIWRMKPDGSDQEQVFSDENNNWFPHISPNGKWMVFLTYDSSVGGHPENKDVMLRLMSLSDKSIKVLAKFFGGQGTINVPSWSPDGTRIAFVSYALIPEDQKNKQ